MTRFAIVPLVLVLSGLPAAAVVCDLVLCPDRAKTDRAHSACHEHASPRSGAQLLARGETCAHIAAVDAYLASWWRPMARQIDSIVAAHAPFGAAVFPLPAAPGILVHGPPRACYATSSLPLRI